MAKKKKCPKCEDGAPLWMTTYGDMVTLLLCFFVMIYAVGKATPQEVQLILSAFNNSMGFFAGGQTLTKSRMEEMGLNLESLPSQTQGRSLSKAKRQLRSVFKPEIKSRMVRIVEDERGLVISLVGADYFNPGSALLNPPIEEVLLKASGIFKEINKFVRVEGHASLNEDAMIAGSQLGGREERVYMNSWDLAGARSVNAVNFLQSHDVRPALMQTIGYGSYRPLTVEGERGTPESAAQNRRLDLVILPYKSPTRSDAESGFGLPEERIPGFESLLPDSE